jgi:catechol 2,3-dioxygenase-like lactoylglutathione lyase family enzyme
MHPYRYVSIAATAVFGATALSFALPAARLAGQDAATPPRPHITGLSHVAFWVKDIEQSRAFYKGYLGFDEPFSLKNKDGSLHLTWIKINDRQSVELLPITDKTPPGGDSLYHIALETDDAVGMLAYLASRGVKAPGGKDLPKKVGKGQIGNLNYFVEDPDGHIVEIVQYMPDGWTVQNKGKFMPDTRVAARISHAGISVANLEKSLGFYRDILGCTEFWRGSSDGKTLSWVNMRVPDGKDYLELMLYGNKPTLERLHTMNHFCLEVPDIAPVVATLQSRTLPAGCHPTSAKKTGVNGKRQVNCFDPDGSRVEVMEANTASGKPVPPSEAPPPRPDA